MPEDSINFIMPSQKVIMLINPKATFTPCSAAAKMLGVTAPIFPPRAAVNTARQIIPEIGRAHV